MTIPGTLTWAASETSGILQGEDGPLPRTMRADSRMVSSGDGFVALPGLHADGHDFLEQAAQQGARIIIARQDQESRWRTLQEQYPSMSWLLVKDTERALQNLASAWARSVAPRHWVAITGSVGKTTTREILNGVLKRHMTVHAAEKSFNTWIGCALTVLGMPWETESILLEMGANHAGEIGAMVVSYPPTVAIITEIAPAHLEGFGSIDGVLQAKWEITSSEKLRMLSYNADNKYLQHAVTSLSPSVYRIPVGRGEEARHGIRILKAQMDIAHRLPRLACQISVHGRRVDVRSRLFGLQHAYTLGYVLAVAHFLGIAPEIAVSDMETLEASGGRGRFFPLDEGLLVDESYNSNPASLRAAIENLEALALSGRRVAVLGGMRELGEQSPSLHRDLLAQAKKLDVVVFVGEEWKAAGVETGQKIYWVPDVRAAEDVLRCLRHPKDILLVKGSRAYGLESLVQGLQSS